MHYFSFIKLLLLPSLLKTHHRTTIFKYHVKSMVCEYNNYPVFGIYQNTTINVVILSLYQSVRVVKSGAQQPIANRLTHDFMN